MIEKATELRVKNSVKIVDVFKAYGFVLQRQGAGYITRCPFHEDSHPSMVIHPAKNICKCFACSDKAMDSIKFVMDYDKKTYPEALRILANIAGIPILPPNDDGQPPNPAVPSLPSQPSFEGRGVTDVEYINPTSVAAAAAQVERSTLFDFLCSRFPADDVRRVMSDYQVGASNAFAEFWPGSKLASAFPLINAAGLIVDVHLMAYDDDGHRRKCDQAWKCHNWLMARLKKSDHRAPWPLFGEHLTVTRRDAPIGIVESEKTALIASLAAPGYVWCATLSLSNLNAQRLAAVKHRDVYLFPDRDGVTQWEAKAAALCAAGFSRIFLCSQFITANARTEKDDLADIILNAL